MSFLNIIPVEIAKYIFSHLERDNILSLHKISNDFTIFSKLNLKDILYEKLLRTTKFKIKGYNLSRLIKLSAFNFDNNAFGTSATHILNLKGSHYNLSGGIITHN